MIRLGMLASALAAALLAQPEGAASVRTADTFGPGCVQSPAAPPSGGRPFSEDCLNLNVWRPAKAHGPLPVMLWFYGDAFQGGSAAWDLFDASALARHGVMVVTTDIALRPEPLRMD